jgi:hypothetical protein
MTDRNISRPLFRHEPRNEQEVVALFAAMLPHLDTKWIFETVQVPFPDCTVIDENDKERKEILIEFELYASAFIDHKHDINKCDWIVCWADDWGNWDGKVKVMELYKELANCNCNHLIKDIKLIDKSIPWNEETMLDWARSEGVSTENVELIEQIVGFARDENLGPQWLTGPVPTFTVRGQHEFFKVNGAGRLFFPFSRLKVDELLFAELTDRLREATGDESIKPSAKRSKSLGWLLADQLDSPERLKRFCDVWIWFEQATKSS